MVEEFPAGYAVAALRQHRWARGDWQLLPWIAPHRGGAPRDAIPAMGRWKMGDNLRRTLSAPAGIAVLFAGWMLPFPAALAWTAFVLLTIALPALLPVFGDVVARIAVGYTAVIPGVSWPAVCVTRRLCQGWSSCFWRIRPC